MVYDGPIESHIPCVHVGWVKLSPSQQASQQAAPQPSANDEQLVALTEALAALETYVATVEYIFPESQYTGQTRLANAHAIARRAIARARAADVPSAAR